MARQPERNLRNSRYQLSAQPGAIYSSKTIHQSLNGQIDRFILKGATSILQGYTERKAFLVRCQPAGSI